MLTPWKESYDHPRQQRHIKKQRHYFDDKIPSSQRYGFSSSYVWMWELEYKEGWALRNWCFWTVVLEKTLECPLDCKELQLVNAKRNTSVLSIHWKDWCWSWNSNTLAPWCEELTHLKRPWCWERLKAGRKGDDRRWDGWMASPTQWTWVWVNSRRWWWTGRPGMLLSMGLQRVRHDWVTEMNWTELRHIYIEKVNVENYALFFVTIPQVKIAGRKQKGSRTLRQEISNLGILLVVPFSCSFVYFKFMKLN